MSIFCFLSVQPMYLQRRYSYKFCSILRKTPVMESLFNKLKLQFRCFSVNIARTLFWRSFTSVCFYQKNFPTSQWIAIVHYMYFRYLDVQNLNFWSKINAFFWKKNKFYHEIDPFISKSKFGPWAFIWIYMKFYLTSCTEMNSKPWNLKISSLMQDKERNTLN